MQTKASHREIGARLFLRRHAKGVEVTRGGAQLELHKWQCPSEFQDKNKKKPEENAKMLLPEAVQKSKEFAKGWQANKDATRRNATNFSGETWPAFVVQTPQITLPRQPSDRATAARRRQDIHPHNTPPRPCLAPSLATPRLGNWRSNPRRKTHVGGTSLIGAHNEPLPSLS